MSRQTADPGGKSDPGEQDDALPHGIGRPATRALATVGVTRLSELTRFSEAEILALHGVGPKAVGILRSTLQARGSGFAG